MTPGFSSAGYFLISILFTLYLSALVVRILLRWHRADFHNPLSQFIWQITNPPVTPLTPIVPRWRQLDTAAVLVLFLLSLVYIFLVLALTPYSAPLPAVFGYALLKMIVVFCNLYTFTVFVQAILSWVGPGGHNPASALLWSINEPLLRPIRERVPAIAGMDLSPLLVIIGLQVLVRIIPLPVLFR